jgi:hypothetical protein
MPPTKPPRPDATLASLSKAVLGNPEVCKVGRLAVPNRVKVARETQRRYETVFGVKITGDW